MIGPERAYSLAAYPNQYLAEQSLEARVKHTDELKDHVREIIYYEVVGLKMIIRKQFA